MKTRPLLTVFLILTICPGVQRCSRPAQKTTEPPPKVEGEAVVFSAGSPEIGYFKTAQPVSTGGSSILLTGRLIWNEERTVRVLPPVAGRVSRIVASPGQQVTLGAVLAEFNSPDYGQAQADSARAAADFQASERNFQRLDLLYQKGGAARKDLEAAEADRRRATIEHERTRARLHALGGQSGSLDQIFRLRSPINGTVVERALNPGQELRPDNSPPPLFVITDPLRLWVQLDVPENELPFLRRGQKLKIETPAYSGKSFPGQLELIGDALDPSTRTVKVRGSLSNAERLLKAEMYVNITVLDTASGAGVEVPVKSIFMEGEDHYLFVDEGAGRYSRRRVNTGGERDGRITVLSGVKPGESVVVEGGLLLQSVLSGGTAG